jgi:hypothetical protein
MNGKPKRMDEAEVAPTGDDYNELLSITGLLMSGEARDTLLDARTSELKSLASGKSVDVSETPSASM